MERKRIYTPGGKYLRDAVHGDIFIPEKFIKIIDCPEFQRLRRIKQLSVANMVYPSAEHTRFAHSIGTFHIMSLLIAHFGKQFEEMNLKIDESKKDVALAAALLHDIGHGPFSHAYEDIHPNPERNIKHVDWSIKIIKESNELNTVLKEVFHDNFPEEVANLIKDQRKAKDIVPTVGKSFDLFYVLSRLVSSQIDADRMDYLLRDSVSSGVKFGNIDISRVINAMRITVIEDKFDICIPYKFLTDVEQYLLGRYQMHKEVYFHSFKVEMEQIIKKIFKRVHELLRSDLINLPEGLISRVFSDEALSVKDYIVLEDSTFLTLFTNWIDSDDVVLSKLCEAFIHRSKYQKLEILNRKEDEITQFKNEIVLLMKEFDVDIESDFSQYYFWIEERGSYSIYDTSKENVWILLSTGLHIDLSKVSNVICRKESDGENNKLMCVNEVFTYINTDILKTMIGDSKKDLFDKKINQLVNRYDNRNHVEIEKKYYFEDKNIFDNVLSFLQDYSKKDGRCLKNLGAKYQEDTYFDTNKQLLNKQNCTLRFRNKSGKYQLTLKSPTLQLDSLDKSASNSETQSVRFEHEIDNVKNDIKSNIDFIVQNSNMTADDCCNLSEVILIKNNRHKYELNEGNVELEVVFDDVLYVIGENEVREYQLEIELKSDYSHRTNLKLLTDELESVVKGINITLDSKFKRGLKLLQDKSNRES